MTDATAALPAIDAAVTAGKLSADAAVNLKRWLTEPQYASYQIALVDLVNAGDFAQLDSLFWEVIPFGTGGRRGPMSEFGSATVNRRTIAESADGMAVHLANTRGEAGGSVAIAHDSRHRSREFAELSACIFAARGLKVHLFEDCRSTPELSFAVRHLHCDIGVMISASHNPPADNGFKAYWSHGGQVLPPHDVGIIDCVYNAGEIPIADLDSALQDGLIRLIGEEVDRPFIDAVLAQSLSSCRDITAIFTPLHGVGETSAYRTLQEAGFDKVSIFEPQRQPDGGFPNVPDHLPNPERPEVFDPAIAAAENDVALIVACDPDADRLGVVVRDADGQFVHLTGNRIGVLLTDYVCRRRAAWGTLSPEHYVVETLVTTPLIGAIAKSHDLRVIDDLLVGFKYIGQTMDAEGPDKFVFGAEESLGYLTGEYARDKDASVAALFLLELAAELKVEGKTLLDRLDELFLEHGYYWEGQRSQVRRGSSGKQQIGQILDQFSTAPPTHLAGGTLNRVRDYSTGEIRELPGNTKVADIAQPTGSLLFFEGTADGMDFCIAVRPSGTEPKIKYYMFAQAAVAEDSQLPAVKESVATQIAAIGDALIAWVNASVPESE